MSTETRATPRREPSRASRRKSAWETFAVVAQLLLEMHNKKTLDLEHVGQGEGAQYPQRRHSMADVKIFKRR